MFTWNYATLKSSSQLIINLSCLFSMFPDAWFQPPDVQHGRNDIHRHLALDITTPTCQGYDLRTCCRHGRRLGSRRLGKSASTSRRRPKCLLRSNSAPLPKSLGNGSPTFIDDSPVPNARHHATPSSRYGTLGPKFWYSFGGKKSV